MTCACYDPTVFGHQCGGKFAKFYMYTARTASHATYNDLARALSVTNAEPLAALARQIAETTRKFEKLNETKRQPEQNPPNPGKLPGDAA